MIERNGIALKHNMQRIISEFDFQGEMISCRPYGNGHINDTYIVQFQVGNNIVPYILQRINHHIFQNVDMLMENISNVTAYLKTKITEQGGNPLRETLNLISLKKGGDYLVDEDGNYWRSYLFITDAICRERINQPEDFYQCGVAFGSFQNLLSDFPVSLLHEIIPNFHNTPSRYLDFEQAVQQDVMGRAKKVKDEIRFIRARESSMSALTGMLERGEIPQRVTHNDTKLNNCMFDIYTGKIICVIDLDTVMPGIRAYDFGDSIRFGATTGAEDEPDLKKVSFSMPLFESYTKGFLKACGLEMKKSEVDSLVIGARLMTLECGMRFLTDYLQGDVYFKTSRKDHNLDRCRTQLKLVSDMENQISEMYRILYRYYSV